MQMVNVPTIQDHSNVNVTLDILEMDLHAQVAFSFAFWHEPTFIKFLPKDLVMAILIDCV